MRTIALRRAALALLGLLFAVSPLRAQTAETVYFTGPNNQVSAATFGACPSGPGSTLPVVTDGGTNLQGLVVRGDLCIVATNKTQGGGLRMYNALAGTNLGQFANFDSAAAVDLDSSENLYAVNDDPGGADQLLMVRRNSGEGCDAAGYDPAIVLDSQVSGAVRLADVKYVRVSRPGSVATAGDILVLVRSPGKLVRYTSDALAEALASHTDAAETPLPLPNLASVDPTGFALTLAGDILVATGDGRVLQFNPDGTPKGSGVFASFSGSGVDIATGLQEAVENVFLTVHQGGLVQRYDLGGTCTGAVTGASAPVGVGNASLNAKGVAITPAGRLVTVAPTSAQTVTYELVTSGGSTKSDVYLVCGAAPGTELELPAPIGLTGRTIPSYAQAFTNDTCSGPGYLVYSGSSTASFFGAEIEHHIEENQLGFNTSCTSGDQSRTFWATDADDPPIVEGSSFIDISTGCGSNLGRGGSFSYVLTGYDTRTPRAVAADKLRFLDLALNGGDPGTGGLAGFVSSRTRRSLDNLLKSAVRAFARGDEATAGAKLESFIATIKASPSSFQPCLGSQCRNAPGELAARADSAAYMVCGAASASGDVAGGSVPDTCNRPSLQ